MSTAPKKSVKKTYIEDLVVNETINVLTPENIDKIARSVVEKCEKERNTENLKRLQKLIRENDTATANLIKALESGKAVDVISAQIEKRQNEKADLESQLAKERIQTPLLKYEQVRFFFERFTKGDANDINYRRALVDLFISKIHLFDDHMIILYNAQEGGHIEIPLGDLCGSPNGIVVEARGVESPSCLVVDYWILRNSLILQCVVSLYCCYLFNLAVVFCPLSPQIVPKT